MATLSPSDRAAVAAELNRAFPPGESCAALKDDIVAAVAALDALLDAQATAINNAIPLPARGTLTTAQKARCLMFVIQRRYLTGA